MNRGATGTDPFRIHWHPRNTVGRALWAGLRPLAERGLGLRRLADIHRYAGAGAGDFIERALESLGIRWDVEADVLNVIPRTGPLVIVANHPFGGPEGLALLALAGRVRPDVKVLANYLLGRIPELADRFICVDPFGRRSAVAGNASSMRSAVGWLEDGHALIAFPAGEVAHLDPRTRRVVEPPWLSTAARLIRMTHASVTPIHVEGRNSIVFHAAGLIHPRLRTALLGRECLNKRGRRFAVRVGPAITASRLRAFDEPEKLTDYLRIRTLLLGSGAGDVARSTSAKSGSSKRCDCPIAPPASREALAREIEGLDRQRVLVDAGEHWVICAPADEIPATLHEIGRLRELTFREVGEGTGRSVDLDRFDEYYLHLFVWNRLRGEVVGAYRLGLMDEILATRGVAGLYTHTLFRFDRRLLTALGPAIELGRSFVVAGQQRSYAALLLLWKGIATVASRYPRYRHLVGAVSISDTYDTTTKRLLMSFLSHNDYRCGLASLVRPRRAPRLPRGRSDVDRPLTRLAGSLDEVDALIQDIDAQGRGIPILLRQYLKLNARLLGFNLDPDFSDVIDGLIWVDLIGVERSILRRYMGADAMQRYMAHHRTGEGATAAAARPGRPRYRLWPVRKSSSRH